MASLTQSDLRVVTKMVQILRQDYNMNLQYQDPNLGSKILSKVSELNDPVLSALWQNLSDAFKSSPPADAAPLERDKNGKVTQLYRGKQIEQKEEAPAPAKAEEEPGTGSGHYVTYRGKKQWVAH